LSSPTASVAAGRRISSRPKLHARPRIPPGAGLAPGLGQFGVAPRRRSRHR
jgi:hypothetical protein